MKKGRNTKDLFSTALLAPLVPPIRLSAIRPSRRKRDDGRSRANFLLAKSRLIASAARLNAVPVSPSAATASNRFNLSVSVRSRFTTACRAWPTSSATAGSKDKNDSLETQWIDCLINVSFSQGVLTWSLVEHWIDRWIPENPIELEYYSLLALDWSP